MPGKRGHPALNIQFVLNLPSLSKFLMWLPLHLLFIEVLRVGLLGSFEVNILVALFLFKKFRDLEKLKVKNYLVVYLKMWAVKYQYVQLSTI